MSKYLFHIAVFFWGVIVVSCGGPTTSQKESANTEKSSIDADESSNTTKTEDPKQDNIIADLRKENDELRSQVLLGSSAITNSQNLKTENEQLIKEIELMGAKYNNVSQHAEKAITALHNKEKEYNDLLSRMALQSGGEEYVNILEELRSKLEDTEKELSDYKEVQDRLYSELRVVHALSADCKVSINAYESKSIKDTNEINKLKTEIEELKRSNARALNAASVELQSKVSALTAEIADLHNSVVGKDAEVETQKNKIVELTHEFEKLKEESRKNKPKYLMFDHGGVLDGEIVTSKEDIKEEDLSLFQISDGGFHVLKNGVQIVKDLNALVDNYGYEIVFHSSNSKHDQIRMLLSLNTACINKKIIFPKVVATVALDRELSSNIKSTNPTIELNEDAISRIALFNDDEGKGKPFIRKALSSLLKITQEERGNHIVFDDGHTVINAAKEEGYKTFWIGSGSDKAEEQVSLYDAVHKVYEKAKKKYENEHKEANPKA